MKYLIGNWKSNFTISEAQEWIEIVKKEMPTIPDELTVVLCPAFIHLLLFKLNFPSQKLGVQTVSPFGKGAYTGFISPYMLEHLADFAIIGHSERKTYAKESLNDCANQIVTALDAGLTPIIAVDKTNWFSQLSLISSAQLKETIVMYEPPEAISQPDGKTGQGQAAPLKDVVAMIGQIKTEFQPKAVIYGGSVKSHNIDEFLEEDVIDGVLPGSASLNPEEWLRMIRAALKYASHGH